MKKRDRHTDSPCQYKPALVLDAGGFVEFPPFRQMKRRDRHTDSQYQYKPALVLDSGCFVEFPPFRQMKRRRRELVFIDERYEKRHKWIVEMLSREKSAFDAIANVWQSWETGDQLGLFA